MDGPDLDIGEVVGAPPQQSLRHPFHRDLDDVRQTIARLSATVTEDILRATDILLTQDLDEAERMIVADDEVDATCVDVEQRCYRLLALQAPVASDLREIVAALRIIAAIERSADLAVNICKTARRMYGHSLPPRIRGLIRRMGTQASRLFREASEAYLLNDAVRAAAIPDMDDLLDDLQRQFVAAHLRHPRRHRPPDRRPARHAGPLLRTHRRPRRHHRRARHLPGHRHPSQAPRSTALSKGTSHRATRASRQSSDTGLGLHRSERALERGGHACRPPARGAVSGAPDQGPSARACGASSGCCRM